MPSIETSNPSPATVINVVIVYTPTYFLKFTIEYVYFFFVLPIIHLINKIIPVMDAALMNVTKIVVRISGATCSFGIVE